MHDVTVQNTGGGARGEVRVTVNGVEMSSESRYLGEATVPVGVFGADADELSFRVEIAFADLPLLPVSETRTVAVE
jgi:hypothetical protein